MSHNLRDAALVHKLVRQRLSSSSLASSSKPILYHTVLFLSPSMFIYELLVIISLTLHGFTLLFSWYTFCRDIAYVIEEERVYSRRKFIDFLSDVFSPVVEEREAARGPQNGNNPHLRTTQLKIMLLV